MSNINYHTQQRKTNNCTFLPFIFIILRFIFKFKIFFVFKPGIQKGSELDILIGVAGPGRVRGCLQVTFKQTQVILQYCRVQVRGRAWKPRPASSVRVNTKPGPFRNFTTRKCQQWHHLSFMSHASYWHSEWGVLSVSFVEPWTLC